MNHQEIDLGKRVNKFLMTYYYTTTRKAKAKFVNFLSAKLSLFLPILYGYNYVQKLDMSAYDINIAAFPEVTVISSSHYVEVTSIVMFTAIASGVGMANFTYQWIHNTYIIDNENDATLTIIYAMEHHSGVYNCLVTNPYGNTASANPVILIVSSKFIFKIT